MGYIAFPKYKKSARYETVYKQKSKNMTFAGQE